MPALATGAAIVLATAAMMEVGAWAVHRFIMHGWGWGWHRSHHSHREGLFEKNDFYAVVFGIFAFLLVVAGPCVAWPLYSIGLGMTLYGVLYFILHDGMVHRRWPLPNIHRQGYLNRLVQAHHLHHAVKEKDGAVSFGFLYAPPIGRLRQQLRQHRTAVRG